MTLLFSKTNNMLISIPKKMTRAISNRIIYAGTYRATIDI